MQKSWTGHSEYLSDLAVETEPVDSGVLPVGKHTTHNIPLTSELITKLSTV